MSEQGASPGGDDRRAKSREISEAVGGGPDSYPDDSPETTELEVVLRRKAELLRAYVIAFEEKSRAESDHAESLLLLNETKLRVREMSDELHAVQEPEFDMATIPSEEIMMRRREEQMLTYRMNILREVYLRLLVASGVDWADDPQLAADVAWLSDSANRPM